MSKCSINDVFIVNGKIVNFCLSIIPLTKDATLRIMIAGHD